MSRIAKLSILWLAAVLVSAFTGGPAPVPAPSGDWEAVGAGVAYRLYALPGPVRVHVARLDRNEPRAFIESALAQGGVGSGLEPVSAMARRYDGMLTSWGGDWGGRGRVLVAINGSSYDPTTSRPYGGLFHSGWYSLRYGNLAGGTGFVWTRSRSAEIRGCVEHEASEQRVTRRLDGNSFELDSLNVLRPDDGLLLFTPQYGSRTPEGEGETEVVVQVEQPVGAPPVSRPVAGTVVEVRQGSGSTPIRFDQVVLAAKGPAAIDFARRLSPGEELSLSQRITDLGIGCRQPEGFNWSDVYASIGGGFVFLRNGEIRQADESGARIRDPRTAICLNEAHVYFVVVDGRNDQVSVGMSLDEVATFCRDQLGADWGLNQDGGGSSTMWIGGRVVNNFSDKTERPVANGLMMMELLPAVRSNRFGEGFEVTVQTGGAVRLGPGEVLPPYAYAEAGSVAYIAPAADSLLGVFSSGSFWWKVSVNGELGWLPEQLLVTPGDALSLFRLPSPPQTASP